MHAKNVTEEISTLTVVKMYPKLFPQLTIWTFFNRENILVLNEFNTRGKIEGLVW